MSAYFEFAYFDPAYFLVFTPTYDAERLVSVPLESRAASIAEENRFLTVAVENRTEIAEEILS